MPKPITQQRQPLARIKISPTNYAQWLILANKVTTQMALNVGLFPTPNPALATLTTDIAALVAAMAALGTRHNKGGKTQILAVRAACDTLANDLRLELAYVLNTIDNTAPVQVQQQSLNDSGFTQAKIRATSTATQFVRFAKQSNTRKFPASLRRISFKKPLGLVKGAQIQAYNIYDADANVFLFVSTKTKFEMNTPALAAVKTIRVIPFNSKGNGNPFIIPVV